MVIEIGGALVYFLLSYAYFHLIISIVKVSFACLPS